MSRWAVSADLQIDVHARLSTLDASGLTTRLRDMLDCLRWIGQTAIQRKCKGLILIGDIFDSRTKLDIAVVDQTCRIMEDLSKSLEITVVVGNHDSMLRTPQYNSLQVFRGYAHVVEQPTMIFRDSRKFVFVPWYDSHEELAAHIRTIHGANGGDYLFTHVLCEGAVPVKGKGFPVKHLLPQRFKQVLLGDVHDPMELRRNVRYVGAPMQIDYRDAGGTRGFYLLDTDGDRLEFVENTLSPRFHVIADATVEGVRAQDFVRVKTDDPGIAAEAVVAAQGVAHHVETTFVESEDAPVRLDIRTDQQDAEILRRFVAHQGLPAVEPLVTLGLDLLQEAKAEQ